MPLTHFIARLYNPLPMNVQITLGNLLVALPVTLVIAYTLIHLEQQTKYQQQLIHHANQVGRIGYAIEDQLIEVERTARQFIILEDERLRDLLVQKIANLKTSYDELTTLLPNNFSLEINSNLIPLTRQLMDIIDSRQNQQNPDHQNKDQQLDQISTLFQQAKQITDVIQLDIQDWVDQQINALKNQFDQAEHTLILLIVIAISTTIMVITSVSITMARPIHQLAEAVRSLAQRNPQQAISISGARDFAELGERLEWLRLQLIALENQKTLFLQHITHELKTPLTSIKEAAALLRDEIPGPINDWQRVVLLLQDKNIGFLSDLIGRLLDYNALSHRATASLDTIHLGTFFKAQIASLQDIAATKELRWEIAADALSIQADLQYLTMVIINLLSNAVKFSPRGGKIVIDWQLDNELKQARNRAQAYKIRQDKTRVNKHNLLISIIDQGPGIPLVERDEVIKPFYQGNYKIKGAHKGSGIGLAIVHECVTAMRGRLEIKDAEGGGTHICVTSYVYKPCRG